MKFDPLISGGIVGFVMGAFGFIIGRFWILPISRYTRLKNEISRLLKTYGKGEAAENRETMKQQAESLRKLSVALSDSFALDLPLWYRMVLDNRKESPTEAAGHLMTLANTQKAEHIRERILKIENCLRMQGKLLQ